MTFRDHPTDFMDNPDGRDYHYRFRGNNEEAQKLLKHARWKNRYIEMYPKDMEHLRTKLDHVTFKTYDHMGYIKGMKKYATSPSWQKVPFTQGKKEMTNANGGGSKIKAETRVSEKWGSINVEYHVDATPTEILDAFENGVNEDAITREINEAQRWAVEDRLDELRRMEAEAREACDHDHVVVEDFLGQDDAYCEDCGKDWKGDIEMDELKSSGATVVG